MHAVLISLAMFGQADVVLPPAPAPVPATALDAKTGVETKAGSENVEELRTWLLSRLIIDLSFDPQKSADVERMLNRMNEAQVRALVAAYKERSARPVALPKGQVISAPNDPGFEQAKLDLQQAQAYRDHLKREYDRRVLQGQMTQNMLYQSIVNNQRMMYFSNGPFGFNPFGYGGLGFGAVNYGGVGFGAPGFGVPIYGGTIW
jgi:hypothetical protein